MCGCGSSDDGDRKLVRQMLGDLADAGLLLPVGGEAREERSWSHRDGTDCTDEECHDRRPETRTVTEWPDGTELTSPWRPVTEEPSRDR